MINVRLVVPPRLTDEVGRFLTGLGTVTHVVVLRGAGVSPPGDAVSFDASREAVSGVNLDEELTNMLQYQHAYAAAGKLVTVINDTLDTLINMVR